MGRLSSQKKPDIDHGWAWVVMAATYLGMIVHCSTLYMSGVLFMALLDRFGDGETKTSLVGAISTGLLCFAAPLGGIINYKFSCRSSIVLGGFLTTAGFAISAFVPSLDWVIITSGVIVGLGYGILSCGLICAVGFYFEKWRDTVMSSAFLTVGIAMFVSAPLGLYLVAEYGLTATFLILASINAQTCFLGMLCKPSLIEQNVHTQKKMQRMKKESISKSYLDVALLKNKSYICFLLSTAAWNFALCVAIMHLPNYMSVLGGSYKDIGLLMSSFSVANLVGRLCGALTISKLSTTSIYIHVAALGITGFTSCLFPLYSKLPSGCYIFAIQLGIFTGWPNAMMTPLSLRFVGVDKLSEAYGLAYVSCGIGVSTGPVLIGYIYATTKSYEYSLVVAGAVLILGSLGGCGSLCGRRKPELQSVSELTVVATTKAGENGAIVTESIINESVSGEKGNLVTAVNEFDHCVNGQTGEASKLLEENSNQADI